MYKLHNYWKQLIINVYKLCFHKKSIKRITKVQTIFESIDKSMYAKEWL